MPKKEKLFAKKILHLYSNISSMSRYFFSCLCLLMLLFSMLTSSCKKECSPNSKGVIHYNSSCARFELWIEGNGEKYQMENCPNAFLVDNQKVCAKYTLKLDVSATPTCSGGLIAVISEIERRQ